MNEKFPYEDIINLPHHQSAVHPHMSRSDRAAQFSPFAALTGYGQAIRETERFVEQKIEPDEDCMAELNEKLQFIQENLPLKPKARFLYFVKDEKKEGGAYVSVEGVIKKIDLYEMAVIMESGTAIPMDDILEIVLK